jgi:hypothetical protein
MRATAGIKVEEQRGAEEAQELLCHSDLRPTRVCVYIRDAVRSSRCAPTASATASIPEPQENSARASGHFA